MATKGLIKIEKTNGEEPHSTIYIMSQFVGGLNIYEKAKATKRFIDNETKVLEMVLESDLREILRSYGIIPLDGTKNSLERAFVQLESIGKSIEIRDRYYEINGEHIIGESANKMTIIEEDNILSCAMEIIIHG